MEYYINGVKQDWTWAEYRYCESIDSYHILYGSDQVYFGYVWVTYIVSNVREVHGKQTGRVDFYTNSRREKKCI